MEEKKVRVLLEKYFEGLTSIDEERTLKQYFTTAKYVPEDMEYARMMFGFFTDALQSEESRTDLALSENTIAEKALTTTPKRGITKKIIYWAASCAAVVMIALFAGISINDYMGEKEGYCYVNGELVTDSELAMQYTMFAMSKISESFEINAQSVEAIEVVDRALSEEVLTSIRRKIEEEGYFN